MAISLRAVPCAGRPMSSRTKQNRNQKPTMKTNKATASTDALNPQAHLTVNLPMKSPEAHSALRRKLTILVPCLFALVLAAGCASTKVSDSQQDFTGKLPRPGRIWVYDFVAHPAEVPADSMLAGESDVDLTPPTAEQAAEGRKLGAQIATELVAQISGMGMPAAHAMPGTKPQLNDLVIRGYLLSIKEGSAAKRVVIGFGSGSSELRTLVEGFQVTAQGQRKLGSGTVDAGGSKGP